MHNQPPLIQCLEHNRAYYEGSECPECIMADMNVGKLSNIPMRGCAETLRSALEKEGPVLHGTTPHVDVDPVNHPPHYNAHPSGIECIEVIRHMTFNLGNAVKYIWRADHKHATVQDLKKAIWYIEDEIKRLEK